MNGKKNVGKSARFCRRNWQRHFFFRENWAEIGRIFLPLSLSLCVCVPLSPSSSRASSPSCLSACLCAASTRRLRRERERGVAASFSLSFFPVFCYFFALFWIRLGMNGDSTGLELGVPSPDSATGGRAASEAAPDLGAPHLCIPLGQCSVEIGLGPFPPHHEASLTRKQCPCDQLSWARIHPTPKAGTGPEPPSCLDLATTLLPETLEKDPTR